MRHRTCFYKQLYLAHEPQSGILLRVSCAVVVKLAYAAEFLNDDPIDLPLAGRRDYVMRSDIVFLSCEILELASDDCLSDKFKERVLIVNVLVLFLYPEHCSLAGTVA